jgi:hypothetical protein
VSIRDVFAEAQADIFSALGLLATYRLGDADPVACTVVLQEGVQEFGEAGAVVARRDVIALQLSEVPEPKVGAIVTIGDDSYKLAARTLRDGFHERYAATRQA